MRHRDIYFLASFFRSTKSFFSILAVTTGSIFTKIKFSLFSNYQPNLWQWYSLTYPFIAVLSWRTQEKGVDVFRLKHFVEGSVRSERGTRRYARVSTRVSKLQWWRVLSPNSREGKIATKKQNFWRTSLEYYWNYNVTNSLDLLYQEIHSYAQHCSRFPWEWCRLIERRPNITSKTSRV